ncbi:MAG TPA: suppressor of fused domain protein [Kofleriaceae bacterium]|nr:suppressor of fused domain protein [Kofleriaceae bacterium]
MAADALVASADELFRAERFSEAAEKFERASQVYPPHPLAWKGLGHSLLCLGRPHEAARAFDRAIGLKPDSATALWGGAVAHAEIGNKVVAQNYLRRTLVLQPTWLEMARSVPQLAPFLQLSTRAADALRGVLGTFSTRAYHRSNDQTVALEIARFPDRPRPTYWTYATIGLSNTKWPEIGRPRVELLLATTIDAEVCAQILANLAFHLGDTGFFPEPGVMVRDVVGALAAPDLSQRLPHVYITVPRAWKLALPIDAGPPAITVAQVVAVSEAEYQRWRADGSEFEAEVGRRRSELMDLNRPG